MYVDVGVAVITSFNPLVICKVNFSSLIQILVVSFIKFLILIPEIVISSVHKKMQLWNLCRSN